MNVRNVAMLVLGILIGVTIQAVLAKGDARITISGGDLPEEISITDNFCVMNALSMDNLIDPSFPVPTAPQVEGNSYLITRYDLLNTGAYQSFDSLRFYFDPRGGRGYIQYLGIVDYPSDMDGKWYRTSRQSQSVIEYLLNRARARLPISGGNG